MSEHDDIETGAPEGAHEAAPDAGPDTGPGNESFAALQAELQQHKDAHLRARAELENLRKRMTREREEAVRYASSGFARDLVPVADNLRRALEAGASAGNHGGTDAVKTLLEGVEATERELLAVFERHAIRRLEPVGQKFDHNFHQALFEVEHSGHPAGTVAQVLQPGYIQHDRLLRPAMVGVAKGSGEAAPEERPNPRVDTTA